MVGPEFDHKNCQPATTICCLNGSFPTDAEQNCVDIDAAAAVVVVIVFVLACDSDSENAPQTAAAADGKVMSDVCLVVMRSDCGDGKDYGNFWLSDSSDWANIC